MRITQDGTVLIQKFKNGEPQPGRYFEIYPSGDFDIGFSYKAKREKEIKGVFRKSATVEALVFEGTSYKFSDRVDSKSKENPGEERKSKKQDMKLEEFERVEYLE